MPCRVHSRCREMPLVTHWHSHRQWTGVGWLKRTTFTDKICFLSTIYSIYIYDYMTWVCMQICFSCNCMLVGCLYHRASFQLNIYFEFKCPQVCGYAPTVILKYKTIEKACWYLQRKFFCTQAHMQIFNIFTNFYVDVELWRI